MSLPRDHRVSKSSKNPTTTTLPTDARHNSSHHRYHNSYDQYHGDEDDDDAIMTQQQRRRVPDNSNSFVPGISSSTGRVTATKGVGVDDVRGGRRLTTTGGSSHRRVVASLMDEVAETTTNDSTDQGHYTGSSSVTRKSRSSTDARTNMIPPSSSRPPIPTMGELPRPSRSLRDPPTSLSSSQTITGWNGTSSYQRYLDRQRSNQDLNEDHSSRDYFDIRSNQPRRNSLNAGTTTANSATTRTQSNNRSDHQRRLNIESRALQYSSDGEYDVPRRMAVPRTGSQQQDGTTRRDWTGDRSFNMDRYNRSKTNASRGQSDSTPTPMVRPPLSPPGTTSDNPIDLHSVIDFQRLRQQLQQPEPTPPAVHGTGLPPDRRREHAGVTAAAKTLRGLSIELPANTSNATQSVAIATSPRRMNGVEPESDVPKSNLEKSRELRTRRLLQQREATLRSHEAGTVTSSLPVGVPLPLSAATALSSTTTTASNSIKRPPSPPGRIASQPARTAEDILARSQVMAGIRPRETVPEPDKNSSNNNSSGNSMPNPRDLLNSVRRRQQPSPPQNQRMPFPSTSSQPQAAEQKLKSQSANEVGWSTLRRSKLVEESKSALTKVDQYLASRSQQKKNPPTPSGTPARIPSFDNESTEEESLSTASVSMTDDPIDISDDEDHPQERWSVRVCVVSAVDFPDNVVPNLPLSPILKVGLVPQSPDLAALLEKDGLANQKRADIRCTSCKILSRRDNGSTEFHEELRWDGIRRPRDMALCLELSTRAVFTPANYRESPKMKSLGPSTQTRPGVARQRSSEESRGGIGRLFRAVRQRSDLNAAEMETANAAAAVAKLLVEEDIVEKRATQHESKSLIPKSFGAQTSSEMMVQLRTRRKRKRQTPDLRLGSKVIPLDKLATDKSISGLESSRLEQWFELKSFDESPTSQSQTPTKGSTKRNPSILLEISFAKAEILDDSEDDFDEIEDIVETGLVRASFSKRASIQIRNQLKKEVTAEKKTVDEPTLEPGLVDFLCIVGARDIGDQKSDDGSKGWVNSTPECVILERFPDNDDFHFNNGRRVELAQKIEWFCFPEGVKLWRGSTPPNAEEMNLKRFSSSSPGSYSTSTALFDAYLGCTTSFSWFVIASNSEEYGSDMIKTYGAVIRFYVPAPIGIDPTQDDFAQALMSDCIVMSPESPEPKRLWIPLAICLISNLPIIGIMEAMLLRMCEGLSNSGLSQSSRVLSEVYQAIVNFQKPIPGVVNCSVPFLDGEPFRISLPPRKGLPALPHGDAISSVCRLLGAEGVTFILSALLTECKILIHSDEVANLAMVAEVMTALMFPFQWSLPFIPVLPAGMMGFIEAPLSYLLGVPSCNLKDIECSVLEDVVVIDLDQNFDGDTSFANRRTPGSRAKSPPLLPAAIAGNISNAVNRLLSGGQEVEKRRDAYVHACRFPRLEHESKLEREFRLTVAVEMCTLVRGLQECLVYASSSQPVFNAEKFLQTCPIMFEEQRSTANPHGQKDALTQRVVSPRSRRFMAQFVTCQHFHQFLEVLNHDHAYMFHEVMAILKAKSARKDSTLSAKFLSLESEGVIEKLMKVVENLEDKVPTYQVERKVEKEEQDIASTSNGLFQSRFPFDLLQQIVVSDVVPEASLGLESAEGVKQVSLEYLVELSKNPWKYHHFLKFSTHLNPASGKIKLRDAIGERRFRAWQMAQVHGRYEGDELSIASDEKSRAGNTVTDLAALVAAAAVNEARLRPNSTNDDAKARNAICHCLERVQKSLKEHKELPSSNMRELLTEAEKAFDNAAARLFFLDILRTRNPVNQGGSSMEDGSIWSGIYSSGASKLDNYSFDALVRLGNSMLGSCMAAHEYDSAYALLRLTAGVYTTAGAMETESSFIYFTEMIGVHPVFSKLPLWDLVKKSHFEARVQARQEEKGCEVSDVELDEYEAAVSTLYEMVAFGIPAEELARFSSHCAETHSWFQNERGATLLMLSRRLCARRDQNDVTSTIHRNDIDLLSITSSVACDGSSRRSDTNESDVSWIETSWCHPAAQSARRANAADAKRSGTQNLLNLLEEQKVAQSSFTEIRMKRSAVTSLATIGPSLVVTGGLDGGVFLARRVFTTQNKSDPDTTTKSFVVKGLHLDWGSSGSRFTSSTTTTSMDGEYGVGAVSCLAATRSSQHWHITRTGAKDTIESQDEETILNAVDGCRIIAGTTCGDLRVWPVRDVLAAVFYSQDTDSYGSSPSRRKNGSDFSAGSSLTRLKFSLRGRALSGHRGGVTCIDVPSSVYRPDSVISGGADGLIKLWSLRGPPGGGLGSSGDTESSTSRLLTSPGKAESPSAKAARQGDALSILSGHGGRILCVKTAWHGDRLLSGGADRIVRVWDLAGSGGRCVSSLSGHLGWVTSLCYWGPHTIVSASTDRSIGLWDARARSSPLFTLRHHLAPISDLLVGPRTDPIVVSSSSDGTVVSWDLRALSNSESVKTGLTNSSRKCQSIRQAQRQFVLRDGRGGAVAGPVLLSKAVREGQYNTVYCIGNDATLREWDVSKNVVVSDHFTGHSDAVSCLQSMEGSRTLQCPLAEYDDVRATGVITASWDGTIRYRTLVRSSP